jgi:hypothetical protein
MRFLAVLISALTVSTPAAHSSPERTTPERTCFSKKLWSADDQDRPCVRVIRVEEDGSFQASVSDANGTPRYTVGVANPHD